jgi:hypothetical protein
MLREYSTEAFRQSLRAALTFDISAMRGNQLLKE